MAQDATIAQRIGRFFPNRLTGIFTRPVPIHQSMTSDEARRRGAAPVTDGAAPSAISSALPAISGMICLGIILFLIAATLVLALIPIYVPNRSTASSTTSETLQLDTPVADSSILSAGSLNSAQISVLQSSLQSTLNSASNTNGATAVISSATAIGSTGRKRQTVRVFIVRCIIIITYRGRNFFRQFIIAALNSFTISSSVASQIATAATTTTTTVSTNTTTNSSRSLVRRSLEEGGAPAGMVYIDAHRIAGVRGSVSSVSFYIDQTCASATVEFAAFELMSRDIDHNTADLKLKQRSGALKIEDQRHLKPYMNLITIRLCSGDPVEDIKAGGCQGHRFPVEAHEYLGVRSDTCRLGFAEPPADRVYATTWMVADGSDPFSGTDKRVSYKPADHTILQSVTIEGIVSENTGEVIRQVSGTSSGARVLFVGSYPPRRCGLATFLDDLTSSYPGSYGVVAVDEQTTEAAQRLYSDKVVYRLKQNDRDAYYGVAELFNSDAYDVLNIQHEYGLFGGMAGEYILALMAAARKPVVITMHTVIPEPNMMYLSMTRALCSLSTRVIVMAELGRSILIDVYGVDSSKIVVIPHGIPDTPFSESLDEAKQKIGFDASTPIISTFGLLNRNKNIQLALQAMKKVVESVPNAMYLVIGQTHPAVLSFEGESYRNELEKNMTSLGLTKNVRFINRFVSDSELIDYLSASDVYMTPYAREDQYVSGTLSWAVGLGKAVVSTPYLYAKELLGSGRGFLVPFGDHDGFAATIINLLKNSDARDAARRAAHSYGRGMTWEVVGHRMETMFNELQQS